MNKECCNPVIGISKNDNDELEEGNKTNTNERDARINKWRDKNTFSEFTISASVRFECVSSLSYYVLPISFRFLILMIRLSRWCSGLLLLQLIDFVVVVFPLRICLVFVFSLALRRTHRTKATERSPITTQTHSFNENYLNDWRVVVSLIVCRSFDFQFNSQFKIHHIVCETGWDVIKSLSTRFVVGFFFLLLCVVITILLRRQTEIIFIN